MSFYRIKRNKSLHRYQRNLPITDVAQKMSNQSIQKMSRWLVSNILIENFWYLMNYFTVKVGSVFLILPPIFCLKKMTTNIAGAQPVIQINTTYLKMFIKKYIKKLFSDMEYKFSSFSTHVNSTRNVVSSDLSWVYNSSAIRVL